MTQLETFNQIAAKYSSNQADRLAFHVGLLEGHIKAQDRLMETFRQELDEVINLLSRTQK
jgi:hypothetical protein